MLDSRDKAAFREEIQHLKKYKGQRNHEGLEKSIPADHVIALQLNLPDPYFEIWQGVKAMHGLENDFLNFMAGVIIKRTLIALMETLEFAE